MLGTSVGAINGAAFAAEPGLDCVARLEKVWTELDSGSVFEGSLLTKLGTAVRSRTHLYSNETLRRMLQEALGDARTEAFIAARPGAVRDELGSAVKFGRVAEGGVDIYPRLSPTCEWDVAAGHAVVSAAGGRITDSKGAALHFGAGREDFIMPEFIAWGDPKAVS